MLHRLVIKLMYFKAVIATWWLFLATSSKLQWMVPGTVQKFKVLFFQTPIDYQKPPVISEMENFAISFHSHLPRIPPPLIAKVALI